MKWTVALILIVLFAVAVIAGAMTIAGGVPVETAPAVRSDVREYVDERGQTRLPEVHLITMPFAGRLERIEWDVGERVAAGQPLARIVPQDLQDEIDEAQAAVARLEAAIVEQGNLELEQRALAQARLLVSAAENRIRASRARANFAESFLAKIRRLQAQGVRTEEELERAEVQDVESRVQLAEDELTVAIIRILPEIIEAYMDDQVRGEQVLREELREALARLRQVQARQQRGQMRSPVAGVILEKHVENERFLGAGEVLLEIGQPQRLQVEADILSQDVVAVREGQEVEIYGPAIGAPLGGGVAGTVKQVYPAGFTKISSLGVEEQRVRVLADFAPGTLDSLLEAQRLGVGYRVRVRIYTALSTNTLTVPRSALFRGPAGQWQVFAVRAGRARRVDVVVGLMNDERGEILQGIHENEPVVVAPDANLADGARVVSSR